MVANSNNRETPKLIILSFIPTSKINFFQRQFRCYNFRYLPSAFPDQITVQRRPLPGMDQNHHGIIRIQFLGVVKNRPVSHGL